MKVTKQGEILLIGILSLLFPFTNLRAESGGHESPILIGWACKDVTPTEESVIIRGQYYKRVSQYTQSPLSVTALALETVGENGVKEQAVMVTCDLGSLDKELQDALRVRIKPEANDLDVNMVFMNTIHTHSSPSIYINSTDLSRYDISKNQGAPMTMQEDHERNLYVDQVAQTVLEAWNNRKPGGISWGLGYAAMGYCRRPVYDDGTAVMYGPTHTENFLGMEGPSDYGVDMLFCWNENKKLTGIIINVPCPSQVMEATYCVSADYWAEVRKELRERYSDDLFILPQCGAAGDISPRDLPRGYRGEPSMWDTPGIIELGKRIANAVDSVYPFAKEDIRAKVVFKHVIKNLDMPIRRVSREEYEKAMAIYNKLKAQEPNDPESPNGAFTRFVREVKFNEARKEIPPYDSKTTAPFVLMRDNKAIIDRYESQDNSPTFPIELHAIRLADVVFATNPFELFVEYGQRIKVRSRAIQTFLVQLTGDRGIYLPTAKAVAGGGYSAIIISGKTGPEGGQMLVDETIMAINEMWDNN